MSLIGALGFGSVIGQWFGAGKDRRSTRAAVLRAIPAVEHARWYREGSEKDGRALTQATRDLETAALIAKLPRPPVRLYVQLATASLLESNVDAEPRGDPEYGSINMQLSEVVLGAAALVSDTAWASPLTRWFWLRRRIRKLEREIAAIDSSEVKHRIQYARSLVT